MTPQILRQSVDRISGGVGTLFATAFILGCGGSSNDRSGGPVPREAGQMSVASQETGALQSRTPTQESRFHRQVPPEPQIPTDYQFTRFIDHSDGTATDLQTGLMWSTLGSPEETNWEEAVRYCRQLELSGHSDWRLPTIEELESIALPERSNAVLAFGKYPTHAPEVFVLPDSGSLKGTRRAMSADRSSARSAWYFDFINGRRSSANANYRDAIRAYCVRT